MTDLPRDESQMNKQCQLKMQNMELMHGIEPKEEIDCKSTRGNRKIPKH